MPSRPGAISLYKITILTAMVSWLLYHSDAVDRLPRIEILGDRGFYAVHLPLLLLIWLAVYFLEQLFGIPNWIRAARSNHGVTQALDTLVLLACFVAVIVSFGAQTLSLYQVSLILLLVASAVQSLLNGREPGRVISSGFQPPPIVDAAPPPIPDRRSDPLPPAPTQPATGPLSLPGLPGNLPLTLGTPTIMLDPSMLPPEVAAVTDASPGTAAPALPPPAALLPTQLLLPPELPPPGADSPPTAVLTAPDPLPDTASATPAAHDADPAKPDSDQRPGDDAVRLQLP